MNVATSIRELTAATPFYKAEDYHQDYYLKNPSAYKYYKNRCGRVATLKRVWGEEEYRISHENGTTKISEIEAADPWLWLKITLPCVIVMFLCLLLMLKVLCSKGRRKDKRVVTQREKSVVISNVELA